MAEHIRVLLTEEEVDKRIQEIGEQISKDYAGKQVHLVCVLKGGSFFMCELKRKLVREHQRGESCAELARQMGVSRTTMFRFLRRY